MFQKLFFLSVAVLPVTVLANGMPCGLDGTTEDRIADCAITDTARSENFALVTRTQDLQEVHKDLKTGLLWGDRVSAKLNYAEAVKACAKYSEANNSFWRLPTIQEFQNSRELTSVLPNIKDFYWTSSPLLKAATEMTWIYSGHNPHGQIAMRMDYFGIAVRCVAQD